MKYKINLLLPINILFCILTIINCGSVYDCSFLNKLWNILLFTIFLISLSRIEERYQYKFFLLSIIFLIGMTLFLVFNYFIYHFNILYYVILFLLDPIMIVSFILGLSRHGKINNNIFYIIEKIIIICAIVSDLFWVLFSLNLLNPNMSISSSWNSNVSIPGFFGIDFIAQGRVSFLGIPNVIRNTGIFNEAPMFSYLLCIALLIELFIRQNNKVFNYKIIILLITIFTTTSTTGIIIFISALLYKELSLNITNVKLLCFVIFMPLLLGVINLIINSKKSENINGSYNIRMNDFSACFNAWKHHIILGNGLDNSYSILNHMYYFRQLSSKNGSIGLSTGLMSTLAYGGILLALFYIVPTVLASLKSINMLGFSLFTFILYVFVIVSRNYIYIIILSYFWSIILLNSHSNYNDIT